MQRQVRKATAKAGSEARNPVSEKEQGMNSQTSQQQYEERMTTAEWRRTHRDFKTIINGQRYVMRWTTKGTGLMPVVIVKEQDK